MTDARAATPDVLRSLLDYDQETGVLTWKPRPAAMFRPGNQGAEVNAATWNTRYAGKPAFAAVTSDGYLYGGVFGRLHKAHRVCWAIHHGEWPAEDIDHINGVRDDNRITNLRAVSRAENARNKKRSPKNTSGATGVYWHNPTGKWLAHIGADGSKKHLGLFDDFSTAVAVRKAAEAAHGYHPGHGRRS